MAAARCFSMSRVLAWFSCGASSAYAAKLAVDKYKDRCEVLYCDTFAYEHPDNVRFFHDVEAWIGRPITVLKSSRYKDIYDVFERTKFLKGPNGARCTTELKKMVRMSYQKVDDLHIFGYTAGEGARVVQFKKQNPELYSEFPLFDAHITKRDCHLALKAAGIAEPAMYALGYKNNNCIGCVKGGMGYWNKIRKDFPATFLRMSKLERELGFALNGVYLDELAPNRGRYKEEAEVECGVLCAT